MEKLIGRRTTLVGLLRRFSCMFRQNLPLDPAIGFFLPDHFSEFLLPSRPDHQLNVTNRYPGSKHTNCSYSTSHEIRSLVETHPKASSINLPGCIFCIFRQRQADTNCTPIRGIQYIGLYLSHSYTLTFFDYLLSIMHQQTGKRISLAG